jgi:hypothetical protein
MAANSRKRYLMALSVLAVAELVAFAGHHLIQAEEHDSNSPGEVSGLVATHFNWSNGQAVVDSGYQPIDLPTKINCSPIFWPYFPSGCTISVEDDVQLEGNGTAENSWAICTKVDGKFIDTPGCPSQGYLPTSANASVVGHWSQQKMLSSSSAHTVQTFVFTAHGGSIGTYNITYRVYQP